MGRSVAADVELQLNEYDTGQIAIYLAQCFSIHDMGSGISSSILMSSSGKESIIVNTLCSNEEISYISNRSSIGMSEKEKKHAEEIQTAGHSWRQYCKATATRRKVRS